MVDDFAQGFGLATFPNPSSVHDFICFALGEGSQVGWFPFVVFSFPSFFSAHYNFFPNGSILL